MEEQLPAVDTHMVTTTFTLEGYRIERYLGVVRGIIVRSRSIFGTVGASLQTLVGGDISLFTNLCEETRAHAFQRMTQHAAQMGAMPSLVSAMTPRRSCKALRKCCATVRP